MKREDRKLAIMDLLVTQGRVDLENLANRYSVSKMTIHRDLDDLESSGLLRKIRGGATIEAGTQFESDFLIRERQGAEAKSLMAASALNLVEPGMVVMINDGSMAAVLGAKLISKRPLTVITNNLAVIEKLKTENGITLIVLGGTFSPKYNAFFGLVTEYGISRLRADVGFISTPAVAGSDVFHMDDTVVRTKRTMIDAATTRVLLVSHSRFGCTALHRLADLSEFDHVITDGTPTEAVCAYLEKAGTVLTIASIEEKSI